MKYDNMYEMIMDLALFKGLSHQQVSNFIAKTQLQFHNYPEDTSIISSGSSCNSIRIILNGCVSITHKLCDGDLSLEDICGEGKVIGADRLFGINPCHEFSIHTLTKVGMMEFSKENYMHFISRDQIFLLNFINYISMKNQQTSDLIRKKGLGSIQHILSLLKAVYADRKSLFIQIKGPVDALARFSGFNEETTLEQLHHLEKEGKIDMSHPEIIKILF